ncbi:268_t:CDS:2 [Cetraspora pellucida]|uniref:268_t:CDS:1 n=1 Tax=Cetraspora pellucida TaxID=1433469 RepID=A0A9N8WPB3_9GLOM|nr:268_t:CDS:2 [Cetraspora pellucida]
MKKITDLIVFITEKKQEIENMLEVIIESSKGQKSKTTKLKKEDLFQSLL